MDRSILVSKETENNHNDEKKMTKDSSTAICERLEREGSNKTNCNRSIRDVREDMKYQKFGDRNQHTSLTSDTRKCPYCLQMPCLVSGRVRPRGNPLPTNHARRLKEYKKYYQDLKKKGLWSDFVYLERKQELGCHISDVREVMPLCVVEDVRTRWPNPPHIPYMGHRRS